MDRKKIAIWGITTAIWDVIAKTINPFFTEIVAFIDSDPNKHGIIFHGVPILSLDSIDVNSIDFILVAAYSGFSKIVSELTLLGVPRSKVQPFLARGLCDYVIGDISACGWEQTLGLYVEPEQLRAEANEYVSLYRDYEKICIHGVQASEWYYGKHVISHACGGYVNGVPMMYTNSKEAFSGSIDSGYKMIECDVLRMPNGEWWCGHEYSDIFYSREKKYTPLSLQGLILALNIHPEFTCLIDVKWDVEEDYYGFVHVLNHIIGTMTDPSYIKKRIVLEVYNEKTIVCAAENEYQMIFTQYRSEHRSCYMESAVIADRYDISVLADAVGLIIGKQRKHVHIWTDKGFVFYAFSTNKPEDVSKVRELGGYGVFTDWLHEMI